MKRTLIAMLIGLSLLIGNAWAADFQKGFEAAQRGDFATALREWRPLAEQGNADAQFNLGVMYRKGKGVIQDYKEAAKWYRLAAEQGFADAQFNLGVMYDYVEGFTQDYKEAVKWYRLAAKQGHADAQSNLGVMYGKGEGVTQDDVMAHMWFNIATANGSENGAKGRDIAAKNMTAAQLAEAQKLARECVKRNYKGC
jgi:TPR repeat protein